MVLVVDSEPLRTLRALPAGAAVAVFCVLPLEQAAIEPLVLGELDRVTAEGGLCVVARTREQVLAAVEGAV